MTDNLDKTMAEKLNPETFDVLEYLDNAEVAEDEVSIYTNLRKARRLNELVTIRTEEIIQRNEDRLAALKDGKTEVLGLDEVPEEDEDTVYDEEINALVEELEKTKLVFKMKSVAPKLVRAINKSYDAKKPKGLDKVENDKYEDKRTADILARAISEVVTGDGSVDPTAWDAERLQDLEERLYTEQSARLLTALHDMVYAGAYFEKAITADFS